MGGGPNSVISKAVRLQHNLIPGSLRHLTVTSDLISNPAPGAGANLIFLLSCGKPRRILRPLTGPELSTSGFGLIQLRCSLSLAHSPKVCCFVCLFCFLLWKVDVSYGLDSTLSNTLEVGWGDGGPASLASTFGLWVSGPLLVSLSLTLSTSGSDASGVWPLRGQCSPAACTGGLALCPHMPAPCDRVCW